MSELDKIGQELADIQRLVHANTRVLGGYFPNSREYLAVASESWKSDVVIEQRINDSGLAPNLREATWMVVRYHQEVLTKECGWDFSKPYLGLED